jgi:uncharacterized protein
MSLADACVERMAEVYDDHYALTFDSNFVVYRKHGRQGLAVDLAEHGNALGSTWMPGLRPA